MRIATPSGPRFARREAGVLREIDGSPWEADHSLGAAHDPALTQVLPALAPGKIVAIGLNYRDHAAEVGMELPQVPLLFAKLPSSIVGSGDPILKLRETKELDYEAELGVVIGRRCRRVAADGRALAYVAGYLVANDVSARDAQFVDGQWVRGKSFDTFAPIGPEIVSPDEVGDPQDLGIRCWVNNELRQDSSTNQMVFGVADLIAYCSRYITLEPGDLLLTGTPAGVGMSMTPATYLQPGDVVSVEIDRIGRIANPVTDAGH